MSVGDLLRQSVTQQFAFTHCIFDHLAQGWTANLSESHFGPLFLSGEQIKVQYLSPLGPCVSPL